MGLIVVVYAVGLGEGFHPLPALLLRHVVEPSLHGSVLRMAVTHDGFNPELTAVVYHAADFLECHGLDIPVLVGDLKTDISCLVAEEYLCFHCLCVLMGFILLMHHA